MNWRRAHGRYTQVKGRLQKRVGRLTGNRRLILAGMRSTAVGNLEEGIGVLQERVRRRFTAITGRA